VCICPSLSALFGIVLLTLTTRRANGSPLSLVHYMRKAVAGVDPSITSGIDGLKDVVSIIIKSSLGNLSDSLRSFQASLAFTETFIRQVQELPNHSEDRFLQRAQEFLDAAHIEMSAAQCAVTAAVEATQKMMDFFGVDMKPSKVCLGSWLCYSVVYINSAFLCII
jgi:hypothetical protein